MENRPLASQIVTEWHFPGGVRCGACGIALMEGDPYATRPEGMVGDAMLSSIVCINCAQS
jgi:hypothetical protein